MTPSPAKCSRVPPYAGISSPSVLWYSVSTPIRSSGAAVSANDVKPRRSEKRHEMYARCPAKSCSPSGLETSSATWGETKRESSSRCRSTASMRRALSTAIAAWSAKVSTSAMCSFVNGRGLEPDEDDDANQVVLDHDRDAEHRPVEPRTGIGVLRIRVDVGDVNRLPLYGGAAGGGRTVESVRMLPVVGGTL